EPPNVAQEKLVPVVQALAEDFGDDAQMLGNVAAPGVDRGKVCAITISLYDRILQLPEADAAMVLRSLAEAV
ncbi:MAG: DNA gyrase, partial [Steroidobacteraceae bacterium]|nr:DNA gyrase [Steroidobacteraceae bacterium]